MPESVAIYPWESLKKPWFRMHLDFAEPYLGKILLILTDAFIQFH